MAGVVVFLGVVVSLGLLLSAPKLVRTKRRNAGFERTALHLSGTVQLAPETVRQLAEEAARAAALRLVTRLAHGELYTSKHGVELTVTAAEEDGATAVELRPGPQIRQAGRAPNVRPIGQMAQAVAMELRQRDATASISMS